MVNTGAVEASIDREKSDAFREDNLVLKKTAQNDQNEAHKDSSFKAKIAHLIAAARPYLKRKSYCLRELKKRYYRTAFASPLAS